MQNDMIGCFVSGPNHIFGELESIRLKKEEKGKTFRSFIWGEQGLDKIFKKLEAQNCGVDIELILLQFYVEPLKIERDNMKEIFEYRRKERSVGVPIIIESEFFSLSSPKKIKYLERKVFEALDKVNELVNSKNLDTNISLLKSELIYLLKK